MKGLTNNLIGGKKQQYSSPFSISLSSHPRAIFPLPDLWKQLLCIRPCTASRLPRKAACRMHTLIGESNQCWNLSPLQMPTLKPGLLKPFSCFCQSWRKMDLPVQMYLPVPAEAEIIYCSPRSLLFSNPQRRGAKKTPSPPAPSRALPWLAIGAVWSCFPACPRDL